MGRYYWIMEYCKVFLAYGAAFYIWPSVVFYPYLKGKSWPYRFAFCSLVPVALFSTLISFLGIFHILHPAAVAVFFYGPFFFQLFRLTKLLPKIADCARRMHNRTMTLKRLLANIADGLKALVRTALSDLWKKTRGNRLKYLMLILVLIYGTIYFSYSAVQLRAYGCSDQYVHHSWVYALQQGRVYPSGIYPEGLHCMIYVLSAMFGVRAYSLILFLAGVYLHAILLSAYFMMTELFHWKYTPLFALAAFLTVGQVSDYVISAMVRLSWTLPQEFAFPAVFLCVYGLLRFLKKAPPAKEKGKWYRYLSMRAVLKDEDMHVFILSVAVTIIVHFYATMIAAFICVVVFLVDLVRMFNWRKILRLTQAGLLALVISTAPIATALAMGYQFQGSLRWAIAVTRGGEQAWANGEYDPNEEYLKKEKTTGDKKEEEEQTPEEVELATIHQKNSLLHQAKNKVVPSLAELYAGTFWQLYPGTRGKVLFFTALALGIAGISGAAAVALWDRLTRKKRRGPAMSEKGFTFSGYVIIAGVLGFLMLEFQPNLIGLPILISGNRLCAVGQLFAVMVYCSLLDFAFFLLSRALPEGPVTQVLSAATFAGVYVFAQAAGIFHSYLYYELNRYPVAVELTERITSVMPRDMFTVVSTTDEYYQLIEYGYHEEQADFTEKWKDQNYTIPTPYIFLFIEKQPLYYAQLCFASGPSWLAWSDYPEYYKQYHLHISQYPELLKGSISDELAHAKISKVARRSDMATNMDNREILESKMYAWLQRFLAIHPNEGSVVYEDDDLLCYCIVQNPNTLLTLGIMEDEASAEHLPHR